MIITSLNNEHIKELNKLKEWIDQSKESRNDLNEIIQNKEI